MVPETLKHRGNAVIQPLLRGAACVWCNEAASLQWKPDSLVPCSRQTAQHAKATNNFKAIVPQRAAFKVYDTALLDSMLGIGLAEATQMLS